MTATLSLIGFVDTSSEFLTDFLQWLVLKHLIPDTVSLQVLSLQLLNSLVVNIEEFWLSFVRFLEIFVILWPNGVFFAFCLSIFG